MGQLFFLLKQYFLHYSNFSIFKKKLEQELYKTGMNQDFVNKISTAVNGKK